MGWVTERQMSGSLCGAEVKLPCVSEVRMGDLEVSTEQLTPPSFEMEGTSR